MSGVFDNKFFNAEVFGNYVERIPNLRMNRLLTSGAIRTRQSLAANMRDENCGNYIATPLLGLIDGTPLNYDGVTNITASSTVTYMHSRVVVGRAKAWKEADFSYDITGGVDFMANVAAQVSRYWADVDQDTIISILKGIFAMTGTENLEFVNNHTSDVTAVTNSNNVTGFIDGPALNSATQKASGSNRSAFSLVIAHSNVVVNLENANLIARVKVVENGVERETGLSTIGGKLLLEDDNVPVTTTTGDSPQTVYTSYILGEGAIEYTNCGAKQPYEVSRDPATNGGEDFLYTRQRKCWAPYGVSFTKASMATASPTPAELEAGANWELVHSPSGTGVKYIDHKSIPIARILSLG